MASRTGKKKRASSALSANDNDMDDTTIDTPSWDTSDKFCRQLVRDLKHNDWLYSQVPSARTLIERGYLRYKGGKAIMPTYDMIRQYKEGTLPTYSFDDPSPVTTLEARAHRLPLRQHRLRALARQHQPPRPELGRPPHQPLHQSIVGALLYAATHTRPDIAYLRGGHAPAGRPNPATTKGAVVSAS